MKKLTIAALSAMCVIALAGCNAKNGQQSAAALKAAANGDYSKLKVAKDPKTKKAYDFGGMKVVVYDWWSNPSAPAATKDEEDQRAYRQYLQDTYNFECIQDNLNAGWGGHPAEVSNYCITGGDDARIFIIDGRSAFSGLAANLWADVSKCPDIDWTKDKWNKAVLGVMPGKSFAVGVPEARHCIFFNKRVLQENGYDPEEPYNLQKEMKWNWENFEKLVAKCTYDTNNDGVNDAWGMANSSSEFAPLACISNGKPMIGKDANGKFVNNVGTDECLEALAWCAHMATNYEMPQPEGSEWNWMYPAFLEGKVAFIADQEYHAQRNGTFADMEDDWGFVCFPMGPRGDGKYRTLHNDNMYIIPNCYDDARAEKIAKIFDLYTDPTPGYDQPDAWKEQFYACFRDPRAVDETLQFMRDTPCTRWDTFVPGINYMGDVIWVTYPGTVTPQQAYEDTKNVWEGLLKDVNR